MTIIYISLLTSSLFYSAASNLTTTDLLPDDMWGTKDWPVEMYHCDSKQLTELTEHEIMNPFWLNMKDAPQEKKDTALLEIVNTDIEGYCYLAERKNIAAAARIGANLVKIQASLQSHRSLLHGPILKNDIPLVSLLLAHNASVHEKNYYFKEEAIFSAQTVDMANLLIKKYKTLNDIQNLRGQYGCTLLHKAMGNHYEPELITLYRSYSVSPMETENHGNTPLMLAKSDSKLEKVKLLLHGLTWEEKAQLITTRRKSDGKNVFNIIDSDYCYTEDVRKNRVIIKEFLRKESENSGLTIAQVEEPACSICCKGISINSHSATVKCCSQRFHRACLSRWDFSHSCCPYCLEYKYNPLW